MGAIVTTASDKIYKRHDIAVPGETDSTKDSTLQPMWKHLRVYGVTTRRLQMWSFDASIQPQTLGCLPYSSKHSLFGE